MAVYASGNGPCEGLVRALRAEFGAVVAARILEAEALDFLWAARVSERYLGQYGDGGSGGDGELSRVEIVGFLDGSWHSALCLVDGEGDAVALLWRRACASPVDAQAGFARAL